MNTRNKKLNEYQKKRLEILRPSLRNAVKSGDNQTAKNILKEIQDLLRSTGHETMLMKYKNWYFEAEMEAGNLELAKTGFIGIRKKTNSNTRVHLEATALLAICYLRNGEIKLAEPLMAFVFRNETNIKSEKKKREFRINVLKRFEEEGTYSSFKGKYYDSLDENEVNEKAGEYARTLTEDELLRLIGKYAPPETRAIILKIDDFSRKQLPAADIKYLPNPADRIKDEQVGKTIFSSFKRALWKALCDPNSEVYKMWSEKGLGFFYSKSYMAGVVISSLMGMGLSYKAIVPMILALIIRLGLDVYCDRYKPEGIILN